jgi:hypothetical protein
LRTGWLSGALGTATLLALTLGCSAGAPRPETTPEPAPAAAPRPPVAAAEAPVGEPEFDPSKWSPPESGPSPEAERVLATFPDPGRISLPADLSTTPGPAAAPRENYSEAGDCREVQLLATAERANAEEASRAASTRFGLPAHVASGGGLYRVRVGGCLGEGQATVVRDTARRLGYDGAFVVTATE